jgi:hypothetical protein
LRSGPPLCRGRPSDVHHIGERTAPRPPARRRHFDAFVNRNDRILIPRWTAHINPPRRIAPRDAFTGSIFLGIAAIGLAATLIVVRNVEGETPHQILNVSYDPTRELYAALNAEFIAQYERQTGIKLEIKQSNGGSSRQASSVSNGSQKADVRSA